MVVVPPLPVVGVPAAAVTAATALAQMPRAPLPSPTCTRSAGRSTICLLGCHVSLELLAIQQEVAQLLAIVADMVTIMLLPAATAATSTTMAWALRAGAIHRAQLHGHVLAAAVAVGTHTAWGLPSSASHTFSHQSCTLEVLWICH